MSLSAMLATFPRQDPGGGVPFAGANNGLSVDPITGLVVLGDDRGGVLSTLLSERHIPMGVAQNSIYFDTDDTPGAEVFSQINGYGGFTVQLYDPNGNNTGLLVNGAQDGPLIGAWVLNHLETADSFAFHIAEMSEGGNAGPSVLMSVYSPVHTTRARRAYLEIGNDANGITISAASFTPARNFVAFETSSVERARFIPTGEMVVGKTSSFNAAFKFQVGTTNQDYRSLFTNVNGLSIAVQNQLANGVHYIGANAVAAPDLVFRNNAAVETGRVLNGGGFSAPAGAVSGYGFGGSAGNSIGMFQSSQALVLVSATGNIVFGTAANNAQYGNFSSVDNSLNIAGGLSTSGGGPLWQLGGVTAAASVLDATQYLNVNVGGVVYKLALIV